MITTISSILHPALTLKLLGEPLTFAQLVHAIPETFPGKEAFSDFYLRYNGAWFEPSALIFRSRLNVLEHNDYDRLSLMFLHFIPRYEHDDHEYLVSMTHMRSNLAARRPDLATFAAHHLPVGCDASGNEFWLQLATGSVIYVDLESRETEEDYVIVAPDFYAFITHLEPMKRDDSNAGD